jgi:hypothetical protein
MENTKIISEEPVKVQWVPYPDFGLHDPSLGMALISLPNGKVSDRVDMITTMSTIQLSKIINDIYKAQLTEITEKEHD